MITNKVTQTPGFDPVIPLTFSRDITLRPDIKLPKTWNNDTHDCIVGVDIPATVGGSDKTSLYDIRMAAQAVAVECVIKPPHLGGILQIGWQNRLQVILVSSHPGEAKIGPLSDGDSEYYL